VPSIGEVIGRYRILERLGRGGMGDVFKAEDMKLQRFAALKFLPPHRIEEARARERFLLEARSASLLDHPNICTIFEIDEAAAKDGSKLLYMAMAYYEGETLAARLDRGPLPVPEALGITAQILRGLQRAHEHEILHRDIKPANLMLTPRGEVKILDFGLARLADRERITRDGQVVGTPAYMAPEQVLDRQLDARTDLWGVGVVLYEMVSGMLPFDTPDEAVLLLTIAGGSPEPLVSLATRELMVVGPVVNKALARLPADRYSSAQEMLVDVERLLGHIQGEIPAPPVAPAAPPRASRVARRATGPASFNRAASASRPRAQAPSVAVLPFADLSADRDQEYFCAGIAEELIDALARIRGLRVASRSSAAYFKGQGADVRTIADHLEVATVLEGSVRRHGERVRVNVQLTSAEDGHLLWSGRFDRELGDIFSIQEQIALAIVEKLEVALDPAEQEALEQRPTESPEAYQKYLEGRHYWNRRTREGLEKGIRCFETALESDQSFARAWAGLADSHLVLAIYGGAPPREVMPKARQAALRAIELDGTLAEAHTSLACIQAVFDWDWPRAEKTFRQAIRLDPGYATARQWLAMNLLTPMRRFAEAEEQLRRALESEPLSPVLRTSLGLLELYRRDFRQAVEHSQATLELDPGFAMSYYCLGLAQAAQEEHVAAVASLVRARELAPESAEIFSALASSRALAGERAVAQRKLQALLARRLEGYVPATLVAQLQVALGEREAAFEWLHRAVEERCIDLLWLGVKPLFDSLQDDPRFPGLMKTLGLAVG
jgi:eukaryotic-like serine/threonine-protein kinase